MNNSAKIAKIRGAGRELLPDAIKALAIILVVWGHAIQYFHGHSYDYWNDPVFKAIYGFHMPIFALVSGYLFSRSIQRHRASTLVFRKVKALLLPCLTWGTIMGCLSLLYDMAGGSMPRLWTIFATPAREVLNNYWFLKAVFLGCVCVLAIEKWLHGHWIAYFALCLTTLLWSKWETIAFVLPYFVLGHVYGKRNQRLHVSRWLAIGSAAIYVATQLAYSKECYIYISGMDLLGASDPLRQLGICLFRFLVGMAGCIGFTGILEMLLSKVKHTDALKEIGASTGALYIVTTPVFLYGDHILEKDGGVFAGEFPLSLFYNVGLLLASLMLIFVVIRLVNFVCRSKWVARLFFGK